MLSTTFLPHLYSPSYWLKAERAFQVARWDDHSYSIILTTPHSRASLSLFKLLCTPTANSPLRSALSTQHSLPCIRSSISQTDLNYYPRPSLMTYPVSPRLFASVRRAPRCLLTPLRGYGALRIRAVPPSIVLSTSTEGTDSIFPHAPQPDYTNRNFSSPFHRVWKHLKTSVRVGYPSGM